MFYQTKSLNEKISVELQLFNEFERKEAEEKKLKEHREKVAAEQKKAQEQQQTLMKLEQEKQQANLLAQGTIQIQSKYTAPDKADVKFINFPPLAIEFEKGEPGYIISWGKGDTGCLGNKSSDNSVVPVLVEALTGKNIDQLVQEILMLVVSQNQVIFICLVWGNQVN